MENIKVNLKKEDFALLVVDRITAMWYRDTTVEQDKAIFNIVENYIDCLDEIDGDIKYFADNLWLNHINMVCFDEQDIVDAMQSEADIDLVELCEDLGLDAELGFDEEFDPAEKIKAALNEPSLINKIQDYVSKNYSGDFIIINKDGVICAYLIN